MKIGFDVIGWKYEGKYGVSLDFLTYIQMVTGAESWVIYMHGIMRTGSMTQERNQSHSIFSS